MSRNVWNFGQADWIREVTRKIEVSFKHIEVLFLRKPRSMFMPGPQRELLNSSIVKGVEKKIRRWSFIGNLTSMAD